MSEEKVIQHSKKALKVLKDHEKSWLEKVKEFLGEILIIVLAVSITLLFHNWNDERHEKKLAREFLQGIRNDLKGSADDIESSVKSFQPTIDYYNEVWKEVKLHQIKAAYVDSNADYLMNTNYFIFDDSRFEGFKSSGYLRLIENQELLKHLVILYSSYMPFEKDADLNVFRTRERDYNTYIGAKGTEDTDNIRVSKLLNDPAVRYQVMRYVLVFDERKRHKLHLAERLRKMVEEIDEELKK